MLISVIIKNKSEGKCVPIQDRRGPYGYRKLSVHNFQTTGTLMWQRCQPYAPAAFTLGEKLDTHSCHRRSRPQGHSTPGWINSMTPHLESSPRPSGLKRSASINCAATCLHYDKSSGFVCRTQYKSFALQIMLIIMSSFHGSYQNFNRKVILYPVKKNKPIIGTYILKTGLTYVAQRLNTAGSNKRALVDACPFLYVKTERDLAFETLCSPFCILIFFLNI